MGNIVQGAQENFDFSKLANIQSPDEVRNHLSEVLAKDYKKESIYENITQEECTRLLENKPAIFVALLQELLNHVVQKTSSPLGLGGEAGSTVLIRAIRIITKIFPILFEEKNVSVRNTILWETDDPNISTEEQKEDNGAVARLRVLKRDSEQPQHPAIISFVEALVKLLFWPGFTIDKSVSLEKGPKEKNEEADPAVGDSVQVNEAIVWQNLEKSKKGAASAMIKNRVDLLECLLSVMSYQGFIPYRSLNEFYANPIGLLVVSPKSPYTRELFMSLLATAVTFEENSRFIPYKAYMTISEDDWRCAQYSAMLLQVLLYTPGIPIDMIVEVYEKCDSIQKIYDYFNPALPSKANPLNDVSLDHITSTEKKT